MCNGNHVKWNLSEDVIQRVGDFFACYMNKDALDAKLLMDAFILLRRTRLKVVTLVRSFCCGFQLKTYWFNSHLMVGKNSAIQPIPKSNDFTISFHPVIYKRRGCCFSPSVTKWLKFNIWNKTHHLFVQIDYKPFISPWSNNTERCITLNKN